MKLYKVLHTHPLIYEIKTHQVFNSINTHLYLTAKINICITTNILLIFVWKEEIKKKTYVLCCTSFHLILRKTFYFGPQRLLIKWKDFPPKCKHKVLHKSVTRRFFLVKPKHKDLYHSYLFTSSSSLIILLANPATYSWLRLITEYKESFLNFWKYSKALRYTALRSADLGDARFLIGSQNTWDTRILAKGTTALWHYIVHADLKTMLRE